MEHMKTTNILPVLLLEKVCFRENVCSVFFCDSAFSSRNMMRNGAVKFRERSFVCITTSGWRWLKIGRLTSQILTCMITTTIESIFSTVQVCMHQPLRTSAAFFCTCHYLRCSFSFSLLVKCSFLLQLRDLNNMVHQQPTLICSDLCVCRCVELLNLSSALWCGWSSSVWIGIHPSGWWWVTILHLRL